MEEIVKVTKTERKNDCIVLLENEEVIIEGFKQWFDDSKIPLELLVCKDYDAYDYCMNSDENKNRIKCLIMDLSNNKEEENSTNYKSADYIQKEYNNNRIPIFIHSGFLEKFEHFENEGTVFKIHKKSDSTQRICESIKLMFESGFLNIFSPTGTLESKIMHEIHSAFISQFKPNEIEEIIKSISKANEKNISERTVEVFERLALRAVYQNLISNKESKEGVRVNSIEHYYRRNDSHEFWTGDIFIKKEGEVKDLLFVATPRCNISNENYDQLLFYRINLIKDEQALSFRNVKIDNKESGETKGHKQLRTNITDDVTNPFVGERFRFLPPTPKFEGGFVDCMKCLTMSKDEFLTNYHYVVSLVDDLTNDVIRKAVAYLLRGGIADTEYSESMFYFNPTVAVSEIITAKN